MILMEDDDVDVENVTDGNEIIISTPHSSSGEKRSVPSTPPTNIEPTKKKSTSYVSASSILIVLL